MSEMLFNSLDKYCAVNQRGLYWRQNASMSQFDDNPYIHEKRLKGSDGKF